MITTHAERESAFSRMQEITDDLAGLAKLPRLTESQSARSDALGAEFERLSASVDAYDAQRERALVRAAQDALAGRGGAVLESQVAPAYDPHAPSKVPAQRRRSESASTPTRGRALDVLDQIERSATHMNRHQLDEAARGVEQDEAADLYARWVITSGDEHYLRAFQKLMRNPTTGQFEWNDREREAFARAQELQRALAVGTGSTGGYLVPFTLDPTITLTNTGTSNVNLRSVFSVVTTATNTWNGVTSTGVTAEWKAEAAEVADASPTIGEVSIPVNTGDAFVPFSFEVQTDALDFAAQMARLLADSKERLEAAAFINGTGSGQPHGLITAAVAASKTVSTATNDAYVVADVYSLKKALPARWRHAASWLAADTIYDLTRQFATGTGPQSAFWTDFGGGTPSQLLGKPVYETSEMVGSITAAQSNYILAYGDLSQYRVVDRIGSQIELVANLFGTNRRPTGQRGFFLWFRTGGELLVPDAVRVLNA